MRAWTWLTPKYQGRPAGGYDGYQTFWSRITSVQVSGVTAAADNTVEATVEYRSPTAAWCGSGTGTS